MALKSKRTFSDGVITLEIKGKTPKLRIFMISILVILPIVGISDLLTADYISGIGELVLFCIVLIATLLLRSGRYAAASRLAAIIFYLGMAFLALGHPITETVEVYRLIAYTTAALAFASYFLVEPVLPLLIGAANSLGALLYILLGFSTRLPAGQLINQALTALVICSLINFLILAPMRMSRGISSELEEERRRGIERESMLEAAAERSESNMDAIGALSGKVDEMHAASEAALEAVTRIEARLSGLNGTADSATEEALSIGDRVADFNKHILTEVSAQEESAASVNQMVASVASVADSARNRRNGLSGLLGMAEEGERRLAVLLEAVRQMEGSVGSIRDMIGVINKIAGSTNLLAMNAAIEAAHAGDAGRGFAVVANEIRGLAEGSAKNAKEIGIKLKDVVSAITKAAGEGARTGESFAGVKREIDQAIGSFDEIAAAMKELSEAGQQILETVKALNDASQGLREGGEAIAGAQGKLIGLQGLAKEGVSAALGDAKEVADRAHSLISASATVSAVARDGTRIASELRESMARIKASGRS